MATLPSKLANESLGYTLKLYLKQGFLECHSVLFCFIKDFILNCMNVFVVGGERTYVCRDPWRPERGVRSPGARVISSKGSPNVGAGNTAQVLWKSSKHS